MKGIFGKLFILAFILANQAVFSEQSVVIHWKTTFDSASDHLLKDSDGTVLSQGSAVNQDGSLVVLGYFTESTSSELFKGDFVPLTMGTTVGDSSYGSGMEPGMFSFSTKFIIGSQTVTVYPNRPATYDVNASHTIETTAPPTGTLLAIRFYNQSVITNSAKYNTVGSPDWKWTGASSGIPANSYFKLVGDSATGNTSASEYIYGNTFENPTFPYKAAIANYFDLTLTAQGPGTVAPVLVDANRSYEYGSNTQITATPTNSHYEFVGWSGSGVADSNASITTVSMTEDRNVTAVFEPKNYTLTVLVHDGATGNATGGGTFPYGTTPPITATPNEGHLFSSWSGTGIADSSSSSTTVTLDQDLTVTANFTLKQYKLEVNATVGGTADKETGPYYHFGVYDINATPATGYDFTQWTGDVDNVADINASTTTITMNSDANVTAEFTMKSYLLTVNSSAGGDANGTGTYLYSQAVSITATPEEGYKFTGWSGDVGSLGDANASSTTVDMSVAGTNLSITANFELKEYGLTVSSTEGGDANGTGTYKHFDQVLVVATPLVGWSFTHWSGNVSALNNDQNASTTVTITGATAITANFSRKQYALTVLSGTGGDANGSGTYTYEDSATITGTASPPEGYTFSHWSGEVATVVDVNASSTTIQIPASDVTVTANFTPLPYVVTLSVLGDVNGTVGFVGDANGSLSVSATYNYDDNVSILAFPNDRDAGAPARGYYLDNWVWETATENGTTSENPYGFTLTGDFNATATFLPIPPNTYLVTLAKNISLASSLYVAKGGYYDEDTSFPITTTTNDGYTFLSWTSSEVDSFSPGDFNATTTINLDENSTVTANFLENQYFLELNSTADGSVVGGGSSFTYGDSADANATPDSIHDFDQWVIDKTIDYSVGVGTKSHDGNFSVFTVKGQERPSLTFVRGFTYSFEVNGSHEFYFSEDVNGGGGGDYSGEYLTGVTNSRASGGGTISITVDETTPDTLYYYSGSTAGMGSPIKVVTLTDTEILPFPAESSASVTMSADLSLLATYKLKTYDFTLTSGIGGSAEANGTGPHEHGSSVTITATADEGYDFLSWSGDGVSDAASSVTTVSMTEARNVTANFKIRTYSITLSSDSVGGSVRTSDNEYLYEHGTSAVILATASQGYSFVEWSGDSISSDRNTTVYMDGNKTITGSFQANVHNLIITQTTLNADETTNENDNLGGSVSAGTSFSHGSIATLVATPNPGFEFVEWETNNTIDLEVTVSSGAFSVKGQNRPTLILVRGNVYNFKLDGTTTSGHPFYFSTSDDGGGTGADVHSTGVTNSNAASGTVSISPDESTPDVLYYYSSSTADMGNQIHVIDASSIGLGQFSSTSASTNVTMVADRSYQAIFKRKSYQPTYTAYPDTAGSIGFAAYDGSSTVEHGTSITSTATPVEGYVFISWSGEGLTPAQQVQDTLSVSITSNKEITANFAKDGEVTLMLAVSPEGAGSVAGAGTYTFNPALPIYAKASDGYDFIGWQGGEGFVNDLNGSTTTVSLIDNLTLTALFKLVPDEANEPKARPLESVYTGWDWWQSDWFGFYWYVSGKNWVYHEELGWSYMVVQGDESVWIWIEFLGGWIWTNQTLYPFIFDYPNSEWIWYNRDQSTQGTGNRLFYRYSTQTWEER